MTLALISINMRRCYRYWAWCADIGNEVDFLLDLETWHCSIEYHTDYVDIYVPEQSDMFIQLKYPTLQRHPIFDRY